MHRHSLAVVLVVLLAALATTAALVAVCGCGGGGSAIRPSPAASAAAGTSEPATVSHGAEFRDPSPPDKPAKGRVSERWDHSDSPLAGPLERFGYELLMREAAETDENVVLSPASIHAALAMTLNGAEGETAAEMRRVLEIEGLDPDTVNQAWADLIATAAATRGVRIRIADSLWMREWAALRPEFMATNRDFFAAPVTALSDDPERAADEINSWVEDRTGGRIRDLLDEVDPAAFLVLVNAIYVKAGWDHFDAKETKTEPFTLASGEKVDVKMMHGHGGLGDLYIDGDGFEAVKFEANGPVALWVVVPEGDATPESLLPRLSEGGLASAESDGSTPIIDLALPRFRIEYTADKLVEELGDMGMRRAFSPGDAEFGAMTEVDPAWIEKIAHKAFLEVNEEGIEGAAGTAVMMCGGMPQDRVSVRADRPFLAVVTQVNAGDAPLFMAIVRDPR